MYTKKNKFIKKNLSSSKKKIFVKKKKCFGISSKKNSKKK